MSRILILSLVFGPDTVSTANMMTDLAVGLHTQGHEVTVLTSMPHYNPTKDVLNNSIYRTKLPRFFTENTENGIKVFRVYMPLKGKHVWRRGIDYLWFQTVTMLVALLKIQRQDIIFVPSPPITLGLNGYLLKKLLHGFLIYDVRELWPDMPIRMGLIRNKVLIKIIYAIEHFVYRQSTAVTSIARSFIDSLVERGVPRQKMFFTPNFVDIEWLTPRKKMNSFAYEHELVDKFVILYAGNIGLSQGLEIVVKVAKELHIYEDINIVIIGDGAARSSLEDALLQSKLQNIKLLPFQPYSRVPEIYAAADVCISPMKFGYSYDTVPSKIYTAMAAGRPIVAAAESNTETAMLVLESESGFIVSPESAAEMAEVIMKLYTSRCLAETMGDNARQWVVKNYSRGAVISAYNKVIHQITNEHETR